jgi:hypothetical protein
MMHYRMYFLIASMLICNTPCSYAIAREDVLECRVSDGSEFVLKSKYDWSPEARLFSHAAERINQEPYQIFYRKKDFVKSINTGVNMPHSESDDRLQEICSHVGLWHGRPIAPYTYQANSGEWIGLSDDAASKLYLSPVTVRQPVHIRKELERFNAMPELNFAFLLPIDSWLVYEQPIIADGVRVVAVYKSESADFGKTWSVPMITTEAKIFEVGKPLMEQSFIGRPTKYNSKKMQDKFPSRENKESVK